MAWTNNLSVPRREMTGEMGLAVKDAEAKKYVSGWLPTSCILDGFKLGPDIEVFIAFYREKEASLAIQDQR